MLVDVLFLGVVDPGQRLDRFDGALRIAHFRDPWSGVPLLAREHRYASVYEVNALPSIELPSSTCPVKSSSVQM